MRLWWFFLLMLSTPAAMADESVRIAVGRFKDPFVVTAHGGDDVVVTTPAGSPLGRGKRVTLRTNGRLLLVDGKAIDGDVVILSTPGELVLSAHRYRQRLEVRFRRYDGRPELLVVHPLEMETYVAGIISAELPQGWPLAAYQSLAIAARTFAYHQKYRRLDLPYHMESSVLDQVYGGVEREHPLAHEAVASTRGVVLTWKHHLAQAYFHAACAGKTESAQEGWGMALPYLPGSQCGACGAANRSRWEASLKRKDVERALLTVLGEPVVDIRILDRTATGRIKTVLLRGASKEKRLPGSELRRLLGGTTLWSTQIDTLAFVGDHLVVKGKGAGHGVGLCQWGARGRALQNDDYVTILRRYYPGAELKRAY